MKPEIKQIHREAANLFLFWPSDFIGKVQAFIHASTLDTARTQKDAMVEELAQFLANWEAIGKNNASA